MSDIDKIKKSIENNEKLEDNYLEKFVKELNMNENNYAKIEPKIIRYIIQNSNKTNEWNRYISRTNERQVNCCLLQELFEYLDYLKLNNNKEYLYIIVDYIECYDYVDGMSGNIVVELFRNIDLLDNNFMDYFKKSKLYHTYIEWHSSIQNNNNLINDNMKKYIKKFRIICDKNVNEIFVKDHFINIFHINYELENDLLDLYLDFCGYDDDKEYDFFEIPYQNINVICYENSCIDKFYIYSHCSKPQQTFTKLIKYYRNEYEFSAPTAKRFCDLDGEIYNDEYEEVDFLLSFSKKYNLDYNKEKIFELLTEELSYKCVISGLIEKLKTLQ